MDPSEPFHQQAYGQPLGNGVIEGPACDAVASGQLAQFIGQHKGIYQDAPFPVQFLFCMIHLL